jgi:hypothetical protein
MPFGFLRYRWLFFSLRFFAYSFGFVRAGFSLKQGYATTVSGHISGKRNSN